MAIASNSMGLNRVADPNIIFKRKFRWTFEVTSKCGNVPAWFVKTAARPNITFDETEINFLNGKMFIPGKATFETLTLTYLDVATADNLPLYNWLVSVYNFSNASVAAGAGGVSFSQGSRVADYSATGTLTLYDGCGQALEQWIYINMWPQAVNFGDLDYSVSDTVDIEMTIRYAYVQFQHLCPNFVPSCPCTPCGS